MKTAIRSPRRTLYSLLLTFLALLTASGSHAQKPTNDIRTLIVVFDGLRPDYITAENMPNVYSLKADGCYVAGNHSVFPTVTRVNASSYATGSYPSSHGLMGNTVFFPEVDKVKTLNTGEAGDLMKIAHATADNLLTAPSLGEILTNAGSRMMVFSSGSSGQAFLQNHTIGGGGVVHPELILPAALKKDVYETIGAPPASAKPNIKQHDWATRAFLHYGLAEDGPLVSAIWFSDPDGAAHSYGIGSPVAMESIKAVDEQFGFIIKTLKTRNLLQRFNIIVTADHGFATHKGNRSIQEFLISQGIKKAKGSDDVIIAGNAIYVKDSDAKIIRKIVSLLQEQPWVGAVFTKAVSAGDANGWVAGTLSFDAIHWNHERASDILVDYNWDDEANQYGYRGSSFASGVAGHGGSSPYEITIPLIASGPAFKTRFESFLPASNIDIVPTILHFYRIAIPESMNGRVLSELLIAAPPATQALVAKKEMLETTVKLRRGNYRLMLQRTVVGHQQYVDFTRVSRD